LEQAVFIKSFLPLKHQRQGVYYRIIDEYVYFYLKWIEPQKHTLSNQLGNDYWLHHSNTSQYYAWLGYSFESVCYKHISQIQKSLKIPSGSQVGTWRFNPKDNTKERGAQIDLLFERSDDTVTICEIKFTDKPFKIDKPYYSNLMNKVDVYRKVSKTSEQIFVAFISANGMAKSKYVDCISGIATLEDLIL
jgi:hypothetical protein